MDYERWSRGRRRVPRMGSWQEAGREKQSLGWERLEVSQLARIAQGSRLADVALTIMTPVDGADGLNGKIRWIWIASGAPTKMPAAIWTNWTSVFLCHRRADRQHG